jgi:hypothetical protein
VSNLYFPAVLIGLNFVLLVITLRHEFRLKKDPRSQAIMQPSWLVYGIQDVVMYELWLTTFFWIVLTIDYSNYLQQCLGQLRPYLHPETVSPCPGLYGYNSNHQNYSQGLDPRLTYFLFLYSLPTVLIASVTQILLRTASSRVMRKLRVVGFLVCLILWIGMYTGLTWLKFPAFFPSPRLGVPELIGL